MVGVSQRRKAVRHLQSCFDISERKACQVVGICRASFRYQHTRPKQEALRQRIKELAESRVRYGYKRIHILLKREGIHVNKKRVHRLYCLEELQLKPKRPRRHVSAARRGPQKKAARRNESWAMDFVADQLHNGHKLRILTVIDTFTRECLATEVGRRLGGEDVVRVLERLVRHRGKPQRIQCDNGSEFCSRLADFWAYQAGVTLEFSRPGKPTDNAFIESFNGSLRDECLNTHWFESLEDARVKLEAWRVDYNENRPHQALNNRSPMEYVAELENEPAKFTLAVD